MLKSQRSGWGSDTKSVLTLDHPVWGITRIKDCMLRVQMLSIVIAAFQHPARVSDPDPDGHPTSWMVFRWSWLVWDLRFLAFQWATHYCFTLFNFNYCSNSVNLLRYSLNTRGLDQVQFQWQHVHLESLCWETLGTVRFWGPFNSISGKVTCWSFIKPEVQDFFLYIIECLLPSSPGQKCSQND